MQHLDVPFSNRYVGRQPLFAADKAKHSAGHCPFAVTRHKLAIFFQCTPDRERINHNRLIKKQ
jgi:hypothetical protein